MPRRPKRVVTQEEYDQQFVDIARGIAEALAASGVQRRVATPSEVPRADQLIIDALERRATSICKLAKHGAAAAWEIGAHYNALLRGEMGRRTRSGATREYMQSRLGGRLAVGTVEIYAAVQAEFTEEAVKAFGAMRLYRLLRYLRVVRERVPHTKPELDEVRVALREPDGTVVLKLLSKCSERDIQRAAKEAAVAAALERDPQARMLRRICKRLNKATHGMARASVGQVRHTLVLSAPSIPIYGLVPFANAILAELDAGDRGDAEDDVAKKRSPRARRR